MGHGASWLVIGALVVGLVLFRSWRIAVKRVGALEADVRSLTDRSEDLAGKWSREVQARKRQAEELATLRRRADKSKRRMAKPSEPPLGTAARIRDQQAEVERLARERDRARDAQQELTARVAALEARLEASQRAVEDARISQAARPAVEADVDVEGLRSDLAAAREEVSKLGGELEARRVAEARMRKRMENQEKLYASLRAELEAKKDRLRTQEEQLQRLQALKVAVVD